jgi:tripartite-type tricarboxylate transporter receptor subunit TctC
MCPRGAGERQSETRRSDLVCIAAPRSTANANGLSKLHAICVKKEKKLLQKLIGFIVASSLFATSASTEDRDPLTLVVGFAAGGTSSIAARFIAEGVENTYGIPVIIENRPGAVGAIAAEWVKQQKGSKTLLFMSSTSSLKVSPDAGLVPLGVLATYLYVAVTKKDKAANLQEYMNAAQKSDPLRTVATAGAGSIPHLIGAELFNEYGNGTSMVHVPYPGSAPAILGVLGGHVSLAIVPFPDFLPFKERLHVVAESADGIHAEGWIGIFAPPGTSHEEVRRLSDVFQQASDAARKKLESVGFNQRWRPAVILQRFLKGDHMMWQPLLEKLGVKP